MCSRSAEPCPTRLLVIGYGNTLRGDDGVGPTVADAIAELQLPGVLAISCPLLAPEVASRVAESSAVIFVDADAQSGQPVRLERLIAHSSSQVIAHAAGPGTILALARDVFAAQPPAWIVRIPASNFAVAEKLSDETAEKAKEAVTVILEKLRQLDKNDRPNQPVDPGND